MNVPELLKRKIIEDVFKAQNTTEWSVLVYDSAAATILKHFFVRSEFISYNIVISQRIEERREAADFPVIYFVRGGDDVVKMIHKDFECKLYPSSVVCMLEECQGLNSLIKAKVVDVDFIPFEQRVFTCRPAQLYSVAKTVGSMFNVSYGGAMSRVVAEGLETRMEELERRGELIVLDRSMDLFSPLLHFFTLRTLLEDLEVEGIREFSREHMDDRVWMEVRDAHLGEVNSILRNQAHLLSKVAQRLDTKIDNKDLVKMVLEAPAAARTKESLGRILEMAQKCYDNFDYLSKFNEIEQCLATGYDREGNRWRMKVDKVFEAFNNKTLNRMDKLRILLLLKANGYRLQRNEVEILENLGFSRDEISLGFRNHENFVPLRARAEHKYEVSRYEPVLSNVLRSFIEKTKGHIHISSLTSSAAPVKSLRKSYLLSVKKDVMSRKLFCVYIVGGLTFEEMRVVYELSESLGVEIIVGSDEIITSKSYVEGLKEEE